VPSKTEVAGRGIDSTQLESTAPSGGGAASTALTAPATQTGPVAIHITMTADQLGRSRFVVSPAQEVVGAVRHRERHPARHARAWYARARGRMAPEALAVLEALVPADHPYAPDFLTPPPARPVETIDELARRIATTSPADVERQLDVGLSGRPVRPDVACLFGDEATYERWRRPMPEPLARLVAEGPEAVAAAGAAAVHDFFWAGVEPDWPKARSILEDDVRRKSDLLAEHGAVAMLDDLGPEMSWTGTGVVLERPYEVTVDWADDGLLLVPTTTHVGPVELTTECPVTPAVVYRPDGVARLGEQLAPTPSHALADLVGDTRAALLIELRAPRATKDLSRELQWSDATVSYHLHVLLRAGLIDRHRRGRKVLYRRTPLGTKLVDQQQP
jgi:DNA-binding transcriptional ArsR family regulator